MVEKKSCSPIIVIGCGLAGLTVALELAKEKKVLIVSKKDLYLSATAWAQGGIVSVLSDEISISTHIKDTIDAGKGLVEPSVARLVAESGHGAIDWLLNKGVVFNQNKQKKSELHLIREGGHSRARIAHVADSTGKAILDVLLHQARQNPNIEIQTNWMAIDLITNKKARQSTAVVGVCFLDIIKNEIFHLESSSTVLATGGVGKVYRYTSNPDTATGDGIALAWRAGCRVSDMEFIQFHPTCLYHPDDRSFLISEALRGAGATLELPSGEKFMRKYDAKGELAPRDIVARSIDAEMKKYEIENVYLNATMIEQEVIDENFPTIKSRCLKLGIDISSQRIPVVPAAHYSCGGIITDVNGRTEISNLFAVGENACTGLHGANRLASNSLLECVVIGRLAAKQIISQSITSKEKINTEWNNIKVDQTGQTKEISHNWEELRSIMSSYVGIVRSDIRLKKALKKIGEIKREIDSYYSLYRISRDLLELRNLTLCAEIIVLSALKRRESRGLHYSKDVPTTSLTALNTIIAPYDVRDS